ALVGAAHLMLRGLRSRSAAPFVLSGVVVFAGCLVREDTLVIVPILPLLGWFSGGGAPLERAARSKLVRYAMGLVVASLALIEWRTLAVPSAPPPSLCLGGLLRRVLGMMNPVGSQSFDAASLVLSLGGWAMLIGLGLA